MGRYGADEYGMGGLFGPRRRISTVYNPNAPSPFDTVFNPNAPSPFDDGDYGSGMGPAMTMQRQPIRDETINYVRAGDPGGPAPQQRRGMGGMFGGGRPMGIFRRADGDPGTLWNHFLYGRNGVEDMREAPMRRDLFGMRVRQMKRQDAEAEQSDRASAERTAMVEQYIAQLPAEQQTQARLAYSIDPEGFAERYLGTGSGGEQWGEPYDMDGAWVQDNLTTGQRRQVVPRRQQFVPYMTPGGLVPYLGE